MTFNTDHPFSVLDGAWVLETSSSFDANLESERLRYRHVGPRPALALELRRYDYSLSYMSYRLLVGTQPFGVVEYMTDPDGTPLGGEHFKPARQISQGQLGRYPEIPKLPFVRQAKETAHSRGAKARDRRRSHIGWVRLTDLVIASGLTFEQVLFDYWSFVNYKYDHRYQKQPTMDLLFDYDADDVRRRTEIQLDIHRLNQAELNFLHENWLDHLSNWQNVWIRKGLAQTILYLNVLGKIPLDARV